jgi:hypothetical protein
MSENLVPIAFFVLLAILGIFFGGEPDLMSAIIAWIGRQP